MRINLSYIEQVRTQIIYTAQDMLDGKRSYIEGSRMIASLIEPAHLNRHEPPFLKVIAISSETDNVPVGQIRDRWHPEAKLKLEEEWATSELYAKSQGEAACKAIIERLRELKNDPN